LDWVGRGIVLNTPILSASIRIVLIMGVAGSGKSTIGRLAAAELGWPYYEADDFHSAANREKMARGEPLDDGDRAPWLAAIRSKMDEVLAAGGAAVFTCSALKEKYRLALLPEEAPVRLVHLAGDFPTLLARIAGRQDHFMKPNLLRSQFEALEPPRAALTLDVMLPPREIVARIVDSLNTAGTAD
jgi:gluconokinase